ncbi:MAG: glycosyltransferase family 39 protein [Deltaproteobacteria bacterium]|nr:glycosyltransferase family 39 protein [Deltaproteobacteria bacterium]
MVQEIVQQGNWLFPLKRGEEVPSKPPLFHWLAALTSMMAGGVSEMTVRLPSALLATVAVLLLYGLGRRMFGEETAFLAALMLATTVAFQSEAVAARVDMTLAFFVTVVLVIFYLVYQGFLKGIWLYGFYLLLGLGVLAKGPVGLILPAMVICCFLVARRRWDFLSQLCFHKGVILALLVGLAWYGLALAKGGEEFVSRQVIHENLARFFLSGEGGSGHQKPVYYYIPYLMLEGLPWSLFLPFVVADWFRRRAFADEHLLFLMLWAGLIFVFFSVSAGKRSVYILPLYPALALMTAAWLKESEGGGIRAWGLKSVGGLCLLLGAGALIASIVGLFAGENVSLLFSYVETTVKAKDQAALVIVRDALARKGWIFLPLFLLSSVLWIAAGLRLLAMDRRTAAGCLAALSLLVGLVVQGVAMASLAEARSYRPFMEEVNRRVGCCEPLTLYGEGWDLSSAIFYRGGRVAVQGGDLAVLKEKMREAGGYYIMGEREWKKLKALGGPGLTVEMRSQGAGPDGGEPIVLIRTAKAGKDA